VSLVLDYRPHMESGAGDASSGCPACPRSRTAAIAPGRPLLYAIALQQRYLVDWQTLGTKDADSVTRALPDSGGE